MKKLAIAASVVAALAFPSLASAMTDADCAAAWTKADVNSDGVVASPEGARYLANLRLAEKPPADGKLSQAAFLEYCKAGQFSAIKAEVGAPLEGSNSFTETQATDRALAAGLSSISALKKDDKGVWRGTAADGDKAVNVAIDFKGNVVIN